MRISRARSSAARRGSILFADIEQVDENRILPGPAVLWMAALAIVDKKLAVLNKGKTLEIRYVDNYTSINSLPCSKILFGSRTPRPSSRFATTSCI